MPQPCAAAVGWPDGRKHHYLAGTRVVRPAAQALFRPPPASTADEFHGAVRSFLGVIVVAAPLFALSQYVEGRVIVEWRRWLAEQMLVAYFAGERAVAGHPGRAQSAPRVWGV